MGSVAYSAIVQQGMPILAFDYGILEVGANAAVVEKVIQDQLRKRGFSSRSIGNIPVMDGNMEIEGLLIKVDFWQNGEPDEYEVSQEFIDAVHEKGAMLAIYRNLTPRDATLQSLAVDPEALMAMIGKPGAVWITREDDDR